MLDELIKQIVEETVILTLEKTGALDVGKPQIPDIMTVKQLAEYLNMSVQWCYEHTKELPHFKQGRKTIFKKCEIDTWLESKKEENELNKQKTIKKISKNTQNGLYKVV